MGLVTRGKTEAVDAELMAASYPHKSTSKPQKWLKYELLDQYGLADLRFLGQTIRRFPRSQYSQFLTELRIAMMSKRERRLDTFFVVKFVPMHLGMMLPNIRLTRVDELGRAKRAIERANSDYVELWFCETSVSRNHLSLAGRVVFDSRGQTGHIIEQVWRCSPRMIEVLGPEFPYPFVRARRFGWRWSPIIDEVHIPRGAPENKATLLQELGFVLRTLDDQREHLQLMSDAIAGLGLDVCFEYKVEGRFIQIIDWDTPDDALVLKELLRR